MTQCHLKQKHKSGKILIYIFIGLAVIVGVTSLFYVLVTIDPALFIRAVKIAPAVIAFCAGLVGTLAGKGYWGIPLMGIGIAYWLIFVRRDSIHK